MTPSDVHVSAALTSFAVEYGRGGNFMQDIICPVVPVTKESDYYGKWGREELSLDMDLRRAPGARPHQKKFSLSWVQYTCHEYAIESESVPWRTLDNADDPLMIKQAYVSKLMHQLKLDREYYIYSQIHNTSVFTQYASPSVKWNQDLAVIEEDIDIAKLAVHLGCGKKANTIIIPPTVSVVMKRNAAIRELIKYTQNDLLVNGDLPPSIFDLRVAIPETIMRTTNPGQAATYDFTFAADDVMVAYIDPNPGLMSVNPMQAFRCPKREGAAFTVKEWDDARSESWHCQLAVLQDEKQVCNEALYVIDNSLA